MGLEGDAVTAVDEVARRGRDRRVQIDERVGAVDPEPEDLRLLRVRERTPAAQHEPRRRRRGGRGGDPLAQRVRVVDPAVELQRDVPLVAPGPREQRLLRPLEQPVDRVEHLRRRHDREERALAARTPCSGEGVEPHPQEVEQRDRRELPDALAVAGQPGRDRLDRHARAARARTTPCRPAGRPARRARRRRSTAMPTSAPSTRCAPSAICSRASSLTTCSAVTPSTTRFTSVAYDAIEPWNVRLAPGTFAMRAPISPPVSDSATPSVQPRASQTLQHRVTPSSRRRPRTRGRRGSRAARASSGSMSAHAASARSRPSR